MNIQQVLKLYHPFLEESEKISAFKEACKQENYGREYPCHFTASAFIVNEDLTKVLFAYHNIYQSFSWLGGHNDGEKDFLAVAEKEGKEESGLTDLILFSTEPISLDVLSVAEHIKKEKKVLSHQHISVAYCFIASEKAPLKIKEDENKQLKWLSIDKISEFCTEKKMLPIYENCIKHIQRIKADKENAIDLLPALLLPWYDEYKRDLPWRESKDAYRVWVSEIMLQQTRVEAVKEYYVRFLTSLPTIYDLADCEEEKLMKLWEGLGYYSRVRNMQKTARLVVEKYDGKFPSDKEELKKLPGIGDYTAGSVSSIAYDQPNPSIDGNVLRVCSRVTENFHSIDDLSSRKKLYNSLQKIYPARGGDFTQSLMELGALVCLPDTPKCAICPLNDICIALKNQTQKQLPIIPMKAEKKKFFITIFLIKTSRGIAIQKRNKKGVLSGMWEFPNVEQTLNKEEIKENLKSFSITEYSFGKEKEHTHIFTHLIWKMHAYVVETNQIDENFSYYSKEEIENNISIATAFKWCLDIL